MRTRHNRWLALSALVCSLSAAAQTAPDAPAADGPAVPGWNQMRAEKLKALGLHGDAARGAIAFEVCQGCHRPDAGGRADGSYPRLAGQHRSVLIKQMLDIRAGRRFNPKMRPFIDEALVGTQDIADIAAYLAGLPSAPTNGRGSGNDLAHGAALYRSHCLGCHGKDGEGNAAKFHPRLAGQHYEYLVRELVYIRDGVRGNADPQMAAMLKSFSFTDLAAAADYVSRLPAGGP